MKFPDYSRETSGMARRAEVLRSTGKSDRKLSFDIDRSQTPSFHMEKQMHDEEENLLKEWDTTVKCRREDSLSIRPVSLTSDDSEKPLKSHRGYSKKTPPTGEVPSSVRFEFPEIDVIERHDTSLDDTTEVIEDDSRRFIYTECPATGERMMRMELNVEGFEPSDITVKSSDGRLTVHGISHEVHSGTKRTNEFCRKIKLPEEISSEELRCTFSDQVLLFEAPVKAQRNISEDDNKHPLNRPVILTDENGKYLSLVVELGRIFKPSDVVVKVRGQQTISITAETAENTACSRMKATLEREFDLPERIDRKSLKAGCTDDCLLKIVARVKVVNEKLSATKSVKVDVNNSVS